MNQITRRINEEFKSGKIKTAGSAPAYSPEKDAGKQSATTSTADAGDIKPETGTLPDGTPPHVNP